MNSIVIAATSRSIENSEIFLLVFCTALAIGSLVISVLLFMERGFLFNNAYIFASKEERRTMYRKPYYRQSAIAFLLLSLMFFVMLPYLLLRKPIFLIIEIGLTVAVLVYVVASSLLIMKSDNVD